MKRLYAAFIFTLFATAMDGTALAADKGSADDVFAADLNGHILAHKANIMLISKDAVDLKDDGGKAFVEEYREHVKTKSSGWADYKQVNLVSE